MMRSRFLSELLPSTPEPERKTERSQIAHEKERGIETGGRGEGGHSKDGVCAGVCVRVILCV